jgi:Flp pilus assembly pilin Flp
MAEYAVVLGLISIATIGALGLLAGQIASLIEAVLETIGV